MLRSKSAHRCKSNPRADQCYSKNSASAHSRITAPAIACPHLRKKESVALYKIQAERNRRYAGEHRRQSRCRKCRHHGANALPVSIRSRNHHKGREYFARAKRKNQKQCPKARLVRQPADFFAPESASQQCILPRPDIETRNPRKKYTIANARNAHFIMSSRTASRKEASPTPAPNAIPKPSTKADESKCPMPQAAANARIFGRPHPCDFPIATNGK